jgi:hypothetical protein
VWRTTILFTEAGRAKMINNLRGISNQEFKWKTIMTGMQEHTNFSLPVILSAAAIVHNL